MQILKLVAVGIAMLAFMSKSEADVLYSNLGTPSGYFSSSGGIDTFGDEIILSDNGVGSTLSSFSFGLWGSNINSSASYTLSLYANDGAPSSSGPLMPGTLLWSDSWNFGSSLSGNFNQLLTYSSLNLVVPSQFSWAISFSGFTGNADAGLILSGSDPGNIGGNYNDYWFYNGSAWEARISPDGPVNFLAEVQGTAAVPEPSTLAIIGVGAISLVGLRRLKVRA